MALSSPPLENADGSVTDVENGGQSASGNGDLPTKEGQDNADETSTNNPSDQDKVTSLTATEAPTKVNGESNHPQEDAKDDEDGSKSSAATAPTETEPAPLESSLSSRDVDSPSQAVRPMSPVGEAPSKTPSEGEATPTDATTSTSNPSASAAAPSAPVVSSPLASSSTPAEDATESTPTASETAAPTESHPLSNTHVMFFSDTSPTKSKKASSASSSASSYAHGLEKLFS